MRHLVSGRKLKRTASHRKALLANLATSLFEHKRVETTLAKAKELRSVAETLITKAKVALAREKQGLLPNGMKTDVHSRRVVGKVIRKKAVVAELFDAIAPVVESRNGGYTRVIKTGFRRGDAAATAVIELVDWAAEQDGASSIKRKKKKAQPKAQAPKAEPKVVADPVAAAVEAHEDDNTEAKTKLPVEHIVQEPIAAAVEPETAGASPEETTSETEQSDENAPAENSADQNDQPAGDENSENKTNE